MKNPVPNKAVTQNTGFRLTRRMVSPHFVLIDYVLLLLWMDDAPGAGFPQATGNNRLYAGQPPLKRMQTPLVTPNALP
jgi:hypothetical protein